MSHLLLLAPAVARAGADVRVVCGDSAVAAAFAALGLETHVTPARHKLDVAALRRFWPALRAADIVHTHDRRAGLLARTTGRARGASVVHTYHGLPEEIAVKLGRPGLRSAPGTSRARRLWLLHGYLRIEAALARLGAVVCPSRAMAAFLARHGIPAGRIHVLPNAIDQRRADPGPARTPLVVGTAANLEYWKGLDTLLAALGRAGRPMRLEVYGDGSSRAELERQARELGLDARFHGAVDDVRDRLEDLDVFVLPSRAENFPISLLEALAAALPVVATRVGGIPEMVEDGRTGLLVEPDDSAALASALDRLATNEEERRRLGCAGAERARTVYDADEAGRRMLTLYEGLCASSR
ncbi:MAG: glycosyltransferase family 4 protein [Actinobacteria bacterium]|nr:glycosyltransferase family 4 protein [Actinomycetota bacterium]